MVILTILRYLMPQRTDDKKFEYDICVCCFLAMITISILIICRLVLSAY